MTTLPWDALLERCMGATEAVIVAPYIKVSPLTMVMDQLGAGASVECFTRWIPVDIQVGASDLDCRTAVVDRGGAFRLHNRLHAKYYRFRRSGLGWFSKYDCFRSQLFRSWQPRDPL